MKIGHIDILLAEDSEDDVLLIKEALSEGKLLNVLNVVGDGVEALAYLRREGPYRDASPPGLVLLDINMPKKNGLEALREIKADPKLRHLPVIMLTTSGREEDVVRSYREGACSYVQKPVQFSRFQEVVKQLGFYWALISRVPKG